MQSGLKKDKKKTIKNKKKKKRREKDQVEMKVLDDRERKGGELFGIVRW